ncbi:MAG: type II toxin-antitoxin system VapC family toxin [Glycomyces artemisiae]|uniref:Ribonuclease VapC n=1 Tax=Glycomyces artemisiae TaxID=1076443 RepID=A0A850C151_9ACTN|nr:type II toxin-antitoxin system VapC family toxin [Glycomyces artemisiae]
MIVVDASAMVFALAHDDDLGDQARSALSMHQEWIAPTHLTAELTHSLRGMVLGGKVEPDRAEWALREYFDLGVELIAPDFDAVDRAWKLRHSLSAYDALYVAVAERHGLPLLTADARMEASGAAKCEFVVVRPSPTA